MTFQKVKVKSGYRNKKAAQTKVEAALYLAEVLLKKDKKEVMEPSNETFHKYMDWWFNNVYKLGGRENHCRKIENI